MGNSYQACRFAKEKWFSLNSQNLYEIGQKVFDLKERKYIYRDVVHTLDESSSPKNADPMVIWKAISEHRGGILEFLFLGGSVGSSGHAIFVKSQLINGKPVVELFDPMSSTKKIYSPQEFLQIFSRKS